MTDSTDTTNITSLRGAIIAANTLGGNNTIVLTNNLYTLTIPGANEDASFTGDLDVTNGNLTIIGLANSNVILLATNTADRVFKIFPIAQLTLLNLTITGGIAAGYGGLFSDGEAGGGIYNMGDLVLENCVITNNSSGGGNFLEGNGGGTSRGDGGGIYNSGFLTMFDCVVTENDAGNGVDGGYGGNGGGIFNSGTCQLDNCEIIQNSGGNGGPPEGNAAGFAGQGGCGGGIYNSAEMTLNSCLIANNHTGQGMNGGQFSGRILAGSPPPGSPGSQGGNGGGFFNTASLTLNGCAITGNYCGNGGDGNHGPNSPHGGDGGSGAGIYSFGSLQLVNSTLAKNSCGNGGHGGVGVGSIFGPANGGAGGSGGNGAAVFTAGALTLTACTIAGNVGGTGGLGANGDHGGLAITDIDTNGNPVTTYVHAGVGVGGLGGNGGSGGILNASTNASSASIRNMIIAMNIGAAGGASGITQTTDGPGALLLPGTNGAADLSGPFISAGHNLIGQTNGSTGFTNRINGDLVGSASKSLNPLLGPLTNNGGATLTMTPLPGSPAIDAGDDTILNSPENLALDQRGQPRKSGAHVDIGAVEYNGLINGVLQPPILAPLQISSQSPQLTFNAATQRTYTVLASTNLTDWLALGTASEISTGYFFFEDSSPTNYTQRFYQVRQP